jgi:hypothetical protein
LFGGFHKGQKGTQVLPLADNGVKNLPGIRKFQLLEYNVVVYV